MKNKIIGLLQILGIMWIVFAGICIFVKLFSIPLPLDLLFILTGVIGLGLYIQNRKKINNS